MLEGAEQFLAMSMLDLMPHGLQDEPAPILLDPVDVLHDVAG